MVQILPNQSLGSALGEALGGGLQKGIGAALDEMLNEKSRISKGRQQTLSTFRTIGKQFGYDKAYDESHQKKSLQRALDLSDEGYDPVTANLIAYEELTTPSKQKGESALSGIKEMKEGAAKDIFNIEPSNYIRNLKTSFSEKEKGYKEAEKNRPIPKKAIENLTYEEIQQLPSDFVTSLPMSQQRIIGKKIAEGAQIGTPFKLAKHLDPTGLVAGAERKLREQGISPIPAETPETKNPLALVGGVGDILKTLGLFGAAQTVPTAAGKAAAAAGLFGGEAALQKAVGEGKAPSFAEVALPAATAGAFELAAPLIGKIIERIRSIPSLAKNVETAAKATGAPAEDIVHEAASNLQRKGVDIAKVVEGDKASLSALQNEIRDVSSTFNRAKKFNAAEQAKVREEVGKKLAESPLEKYYEPKKVVEHRPETIAKEAERVKPLQLSVKQNERRLQNLQYQIFKAEEELVARGAGMPAVERERIQSLIDNNRLAHTKALSEIKNAEFEIKHKRAPQTTEQIQKQIEEQHKLLREGIKNPTTEKLADVRKRLDKDKEAIELGQKLIARGEIPGKEVFDEYIKILQEYNKGYSELSNEIKSFIKDNKGDAKFKKKIANAENLLKLVDDMQEAGKAKLALHADKRKAMRALEKPSGAFYRQVLSDAKKDIDQFRNVIPRWKDIKVASEEIKVHEAAKKAIRTPKEEARVKLESSKKIAEDASKVAKNPSETNINNISNETGIPEKNISPFLKGMKEDVEKMQKSVSAGKETAKEIEDLANETTAKILKWIPKKNLTKAFVIGTMQGLGEEILHYKPPKYAVSIAASVLLERGAKGGGTQIITTAGLSQLVYQGWKYIFDSIHAQQLRSLKNTPEFSKKLNEFKESFGPTRANKIYKKSLQS